MILMTLNLLGKISMGRPRPWAAAATAIALAVSLGGCISSTAPILSDAKPVIGERGQLHFYSLYDGTAHGQSTVTFRWTGTRYVTSGRINKNRSPDIADFTLHAYDGRDLIVQSRNVRSARRVEYALARRLAEGTYLIIPIDENHADEGARGRFCANKPDAPCQIETPEQLFIFARATAARSYDTGGLAIVLPAAKAGP